MELPSANRSELMVFLSDIALYILVLLLVIAVPLLGLVAAAIGTWHALAAGSIFYLALGVIILLMALAIFQSHKKGDLTLLVLLLTGAAAWFLIDAQTQARLLGWAEGLAARTELLTGLLVLMVIALVLIYAFRLITRPATRFRLALAGIPLILLITISASGASFIYLS